ncbi:MAG: hypothetical protein AAGC93_21480 [Cyanobacteria bacterium P01_F01_bin.53]
MLITSETLHVISGFIGADQELGCNVYRSVAIATPQAFKLTPVLKLHPWMQRPKAPR